MEARREQQLEADRLRRQSLESTEPRLEMLPLSCLSRPPTHVHQVLLLLRSEVLSKNIMSEAFSHRCLLYTSPSPRDRQKSRMPSSA